jgi:hypothetical protein
MGTAARRLVWERANHRCEYCRLAQSAAAFLTFHVEHIRARQHGGEDDTANLALACPYCNRFKGPNLSAIDPQTARLAPLFNPRVHSWEEHFTWEGAAIVGLTPVGRATVGLLKMNEQTRLEMRAELSGSGDQ